MDFDHYSWRPPAKQDLPMTVSARRLPVGAEVFDGGTSFRVWAPVRKSVEVVLDDGRAFPLAAEPGGYFSNLIDGVGAGARYRLRLDGERVVPDPASPSPPEGPHGPPPGVGPPAVRRPHPRWKGGPRPADVV